MTWSAPKTNWYGATDIEGRYTGDRFNASDFNRIKNNLEFLRDFAKALYGEFTINSLGPDRTPEDYFYADEINALEQNLVLVNANTFKRPYGESLTYFDNGSTMDFLELNRLENAILDLYSQLTNQLIGRRMFTWNFGMKGGEL